MSDYDLPTLGTLKEEVTASLTNEQKALIGHLANNPLCTIIANLSWLLEEIDKDHALDSDEILSIRDALQAAQRLQAVIGTLLVKVDPK